MHTRQAIAAGSMLAALAGAAAALFAFLPPVDSAPPLTLSISDPGEVSRLGQPLPVRATLKNAGPAKIEGSVRLGVIDDWRVEGAPSIPFAMEAHSSLTLDFSVIPGEQSFTALYPIHAYADFRSGGDALTAHAVLIASVTARKGVWTPPLDSVSDGIPPQGPEPEAERLARREKAMQQAESAWEGRPSAWSWRLESEAGKTGASIVLGPAGIADAFIAFADGRRRLVFDGFTMQVNGRSIGAGKTDFSCHLVEAHFDAGRGRLVAYIARGRRLLPLEASVWAEKGALRIAFSMPGVHRDARGEPRFTSLAIGPASEAVRRVYAGFGNVLQDPGPFDLEAGGFTLSTRHTGMDFKNGLSMVQATDLFPDRLHVDPATRACSLVAHNDATFSFIPSTHGAFAAARVYRSLAGIKPAGGVANLLGRVCLDQWGGDYRTAARDVELAARYGLTHAIFVKHAWQRWGYDYRLPDIYPPEGSLEDFRAMADACKSHGILFCPHDNYIDFYPDATGFSYDDIVFNADGTPQKAWFNKGRGALSYRWSPNAFGPFLERNLNLVKTGFAPTAYFLDVFSAIAPFDFYDRQGRFFRKTVTVQRWGAAFDRIREVLGNNAPTLSEAGEDALVGHLDGGEADHCGWTPGGKGAFRSWNMAAADGERTPWHDMATHGSFVLMAGGLGSRYAGGQDDALHGYGSDDYLSLTVLGGRNPMCDGPFSRRAVMTYWLLHDVCDSLAHEELLALEFAGDDIHRQAARFSGGGVARVNRGNGDWTLDGEVLPPFGFVAKAGGNEAGITRRAGILSAYAQSPGVFFADARPPFTDGQGQVRATVRGVEDLGNRRFRILIDWQVLQPVPAGFKPFVHLVDERGDGEGILYQASVRLEPSALAKVGTYASEAEGAMPAGLEAPVAIRFGLFNPGGDARRLPMSGPLDPGGRARGGRIRVKDGVIQWQAEPAVPGAIADAGRSNSDNIPVDFGPVITNGAFRLLHAARDWELIPLPHSSGFSVALRLDRLEARGAKVTAISATDENGAASERVPFTQEGENARFDTAAGVFAYRISFGR